MNEPKDYINQQACEWSVKLSGEDVDAAMLEEFEAWRAASPEHAEAFVRTENIWHNLTQLEHLQTQAILPELRQSQNKSQSQNQSQAQSENSNESIWSAITAWLTPRPLQLGVAFTVLMAVLIGFWSLGEKNSELHKPTVLSFQTEQQQIKEVKLEDGSHITLGPSSLIRVTLSADKRNVALIKGEGFFNVARDERRPFVVSTEATHTTVLGTAFNVKRFGQRVKVLVQEGLVSVGHSQAKTTGVQLTPGQGVEADLKGQTLKTIDVNAADVGAWAQQRLNYHNATLEELVNDINRYSNTRVIIASPELEQLRVTMSVETAEVDGMLDDLSLLLPITVNRDRVESIIILPR